MLAYRTREQHASKNLTDNLASAKLFYLSVTIFHDCPDMWLKYNSWKHLNTRHQILTSPYRLEKKCFNMGYYNPHWVDERFQRNQLNLWRQRQMTVHRREITRERYLPGKAFLMNILSLGVSHPGDRRSIRRLWACDGLAEMLSGRAAQAFSPVSVSPSGAAWVKSERHVFQASRSSKSVSAGCC